jgi:hypothetical protein
VGFLFYQAIRTIWQVFSYQLQYFNYVHFLLRLNIVVGLDALSVEDALGGD